jgi:hypothetical protein
MQAPPPTGTTGNAPPPVVLPGGGWGPGAGLENALAAATTGAAADGSAPPRAAAHPTIAIATIQTNFVRIKVTRYRSRGRSRGRGRTLRLAVTGSGLMVWATAGASEPTDAPTVEADDAAAGIRQRGKPGRNHAQGAAVGSTAGIRWGQRHFAGRSARNPRIRCRCACGRGDGRTTSDH